MWQRGRNLQDGIWQFWCDVAGGILFILSSCRMVLAVLVWCGEGYPAHPKILKILIQTRRNRSVPSTEYCSCDY